VSAAPQALPAAAARSFLFVPGDRPERFEKAAASGADAVIIDLEDAVAPAAKEAARHNAAEWLRAGRPALVRVNAVGAPGHEHDIAALRGLGAAVVVPKAESAEALAAVHAALGGVDVVALVESVRGVRAVDSLASAAGVRRLALGNADLAAELGVDAGSHAALALVRSTLVLASAGAGLPAPVDGPTIAFDRPEVLEADLVHARELGFGGKLCIHPRQVAAANEALRPGEAELAWARRILEAAGSTDGVVAVDGAMIDAPVVRRAEQIVARALL
jgi:citrate lyase subunit beta / citryl-CoA lyase